LFLVSAHRDGQARGNKLSEEETGNEKNYIIDKSRVSVRKRHVEDLPLPHGRSRIIVVGPRELTNQHPGGREIDRRRNIMLTLDDLKQWLSLGGRVQVTTYTKSTLYNKRHMDMFFLDRSGDLCVKRGKQSECIKYCDVRLVGG
jgi:hypothetical protein